MAKKRKSADVSAPVAPTLEAVAAEVGDEGALDPEKFIAIDTGGGSFTPLPMLPGHSGRERTITYEGRSYEHVAEHRGVWAYRHLG